MPEQGSHRPKPSVTLVGPDFLGGQVHIERLPLYRRDFLMPLERRAG